jgi:hypothetical protein
VTLENLVGNAGDGPTHLVLVDQARDRVAGHGARNSGVWA